MCLAPRRRDKRRSRLRRCRADDLTSGSQVRPELLYALRGLRGSCCPSPLAPNSLSSRTGVGEVALTPASEGQGFTVWFLPASNGPERVSVTDARPAAGMAASPASPRHCEVLSTRPAGRGCVKADTRPPRPTVSAGCRAPKASDPLGLGARICIWTCAPDVAGSELL